ncbi:hypothetical protein IC575_024878 [Cucumis melo]
MHKILDVDLDRFRAWITDKRTNDKVHETFHGKKSKIFFRDCLCVTGGWHHLDTLFLFIRFKIKAVGIPSAQNFITIDTIFMVWDSFLSLTSAEEMRSMLLLIQELVSDLLDSTGFFARSLAHKQPWLLVIVDSISLCGVFTIKYFEYVAVGFDLDTLCQENISYFRKQLAFQLWTNTTMY